MHTNPDLFVCLELGGRRPTPHQVRVVAAHEVETDRDQDLDVHVAMVTAERGVDLAKEVVAEDGSSVSDQELVQLLQVLRVFVAHARRRHRAHELRGRSEHRLERRERVERARRVVALRVQKDVRVQRVDLRRTRFRRRFWFAVARFGLTEQVINNKGPIAVLRMRAEEAFLDVVCLVYYHAH